MIKVLEKPILKSKKAELMVKIIRKSKLFF